MKFTILLTLLCTLPVSASLYSQETRLNLSAKDKTLREVIKMIENHSDYRFFFSDDYIDMNKKVNVTAKNKRIDDVLNNLLADGTITYKVMENNVIVITPNSRQGNEISGKVTDEQTGEPLPGVNILIQGTSKGTTTKIDGTYAISVSPGEVLVFSYVGYISEEVRIVDQTTLNISLAPDLQQLDEIVVVGYGAVKKRDLTGSVSSMDNKMVAARGTNSPMEAVQGQAAGVNISASTGRVGDTYKIQVRGVNTLASGTARDPLYVVDGIFTDNINFLNPQEIERIDILKDASSTAIYGSRGSNGVVIVTTRRGSDISEKTQISYDGYYGIRDVARMPDFMNGDRWWEYRQDAYITGYVLDGASNYTEDVLNTTQYSTSEVLRNRIENKDYTDWPSLFQRTGQQQNHFLTISGQRNDVSYIIGLGYQEEKGNITRESNNKYNIKANIINKISDKWNSGININLSQSETELGSPTAIQEAYRMPPLLAPYDSLGNLVFQPGKYAGISFTSTVNPLWDQNDAYNNTLAFQGLSNIFLEFKPMDWLSLKSTFSAGLRNIRNGQYFGSHTSVRNLRDPAASLEKTENFDYTLDNQFNINKEKNGHSINFLGMQSIYYTRLESSFINVQNLPYNSRFDNLGSATTIDGVGSEYQKTTLVSFITRINYGYQDKYLVTLSDRWDGSSK
ncbi:MAG TPA: SusC/RagA family TonB-linked outer membrane protein, partial [Bacteroidales bacterium]|nr:SusC/RagA family TonB-linked outer membrane protein [Bacteroidales bacterium]